MLSGERWDGLRRSRAEADKAVTATHLELAEHQSRLERLRLFDDATLDLLRRAELRAELATYADLPTLRAGFCEEYDEAAGTHRNSALQHTILEAQRLDLQAQLNEVVVDDRWLECEASIEALRDSWTESRTAILALDSLRAQMETDARAVVICREKLGLPRDDESPRLTSVARRKVARLLTEAQTATGDVDRAKRAHDRAIGNEQNAVRVLEAAPRPVQPAVLDAALADAELRLVDHGRVTELATDLDTAETRVHEAIVALAPWTGKLEQLVPGLVPDEARLAVFQADFAAIDKNETSLAGDLKRTSKELKQCEQELEAFRETLDVPTEVDLEQARTQRDNLWKSIRSAGVATAEPVMISEFEEAMKRADLLADRLRREADRVARKASLLVAKRGHEDEQARLEERRTDLADQRRSLQERWLAVWEPLSIHPGTVAEQRAWLARLETARTARTNALELASKRTAILEGLQKTSRVVLDQICMRASEESASLETLPLPGLVARARALVTADRTLDQQRKTLVADLELARAAVLEQASALESARQALKLWAEQWAEALAAAGLPLNSEPGEAAPALEDRANYDAARETAEKSAKHSEEAEQKLATIRAEVLRLSVYLGLENADAPLETVVSSLSARLVPQREAASRRTDRKKQLAALEKQFETASRSLKESQARMDALAAEAGFGALELPGLVERLRARMGLQVEAQAVENRLRAVSKRLTVDELATEAEADDSMTRAGRIADFQGQIQELQARLDLLNQRVGEDRKEMELMEASARGGKSIEAAGAIQDLIARIGNEADHYAELRIASAILKRALETYRKQNQGGILERAGQIFEQLTGGSLVGLDSHEEDGALALIGLRPGTGQPLRVREMSEGTRDQLYLALKIASLEEHLRSGPVLPLVLDDVLVNFDDSRARATLQVLADLSKKTQVLLFTHHAHLRDLAETCLPADSLYVRSLRGD